MASSLGLTFHRCRIMHLFPPLRSQCGGQRHANLDPLRSSQQTKCASILCPLISRSNSTLAITLAKKHVKLSSMSSYGSSFSPQLLTCSSLVSSILPCR